MTQATRSLPLFLLQASNLCSGLGNSIVMIAIPWLVLEESGSAAFAGVVLAAASLPPLLIAPLSGWMVDRFGRRAISIGADILSALSALAFPLVSAVYGLSAPTILLLAVIGALFDPAGYTARRTLLTDTARASGVDQARLNGIHEGVFSIGWIAGPALGTWLIASFGAVSPFWLAAALFSFASTCIVALRVGDLGQEARARGTDSTVGLAGMLRGFVVLWQDRLLRTLTIALLVIAAVYLPSEAIVLASYFESLDEPRSLGVVISLLATGATLGAFGYGWLSRRLSRRTLVRMTMLGSAASIMPMALLPPLPILATAAFFLGFFWGPINPTLSTLIQSRVPDDQQGRVYSAQMSAYYAAPPLGMLLAGIAVERLGVHATYLVLALALVVTAVAVSFNRTLRKEL